jgi:hypothetical protein
LGYKDIYRRLLGFDCFANGMWKKVSLQHNRAFETFSPLAFSGFWLGLRAAKSPHLRLDARWFGLCRRV